MHPLIVASDGLSKLNQQFPMYPILIYIDNLQ